MNEEFINDPVPVRVAGQALWKRRFMGQAGIIGGWLPIGKATRNGKCVTSIVEMDSRLGRIYYFISPKRL